MQLGIRRFVFREAIGSLGAEGALASHTDLRRDTICCAADLHQGPVSDCRRRPAGFIQATVLSALAQELSALFWSVIDPGLVS